MTTETTKTDDEAQSRQLITEVFPATQHVTPDHAVEGRQRGGQSRTGHQEFWDCVEGIVGELETHREQATHAGAEAGLNAGSAAQVEIQLLHHRRDEAGPPRAGVDNETDGYCLRDWAALYLEHTTSVLSRSRTPIQDQVIMNGRCEFAHAINSARFNPDGTRGGEYRRWE